VCLRAFDTTTCLVLGNIKNDVMPGEQEVSIFLKTKIGWLEICTLTIGLGLLPISPFERSRWRDRRFACYAPHVMPQDSAFNFDFRFSLIFVSQTKSIGCKRKKIQFP